MAAVAAVAAAVLLVGGGVLLLAGVRSRPASPGAPPAGPSMGPSGALIGAPADAPAPLPTPPAVFAGVDWRNSTLVLPSSPAAATCPTGQVQLTDGQYVGDGASLRVTLPYGASGGIRYGDLTGDGQPEAVLTAGCDDGFYHRPGSTGIAPRFAPDSFSVLLVVARQGAGLSVLDVVSTMRSIDDHEARDVVIAGGALKVAGWPDGFHPLTPPVRTTYRWDGARMAVSGPPPAARSLYHDRLLLPALVDVDGSVACPGGEVTFAGDGMNPPTANLGGTTYTADVGRAAMSRRLSEAYSIDLDGDDILELVVAMACRAGDGTERTSLYVARQEADRFVVVDMPFADSRGPGWRPLIDYFTPQDGVLQLRLGPPVTERTVRWDGAQFADRVGHFRW
jgi:hypothetical protein